MMCNSARTHCVKRRGGASHIAQGCVCHIIIRALNTGGWRKQAEVESWVLPMHTTEYFYRSSSMMASTRNRDSSCRTDVTAHSIGASVAGADSQPTL